MALVAVLLGALCAYPAVATADSFDPVSFGAGASTLGYGVILERPLLFDLGVRIATGALSSSTERVSAGGPWTSTLHESNVVLAADWHPYSGRWRLSAGLLFGSDNVTHVAESFGPNYVLNGNSYPVAAAGTVSAKVVFVNPSPYLTFGGGTGIVKGLTIAFDAGIVIRNGTLSTSSTGPLQTNPQFQSDLTASAMQFRYRFIQPVVGIGLVLRP